jgi:hypothetical protein
MSCRDDAFKEIYCAHASVAGVMQFRENLEQIFLCYEIIK